MRAKILFLLALLPFIQSNSSFAEEPDHLQQIPLITKLSINYISSNSR